MRPLRRARSPLAATLVTTLVAALACDRPAARADASADAPGTTAPSAAAAGLDSLNGRLADAYSRRDTARYAALWTDSAVFEWPAVAPVRGPRALAAMANDIWAPERDVSLRVIVASRRVAPTHAAESGAFEQRWRDTAGVAWVEYGRYASVAARHPDGTWRLDRWLGFEDSTRRAR